MAGRPKKTVRVAKTTKSPQIVTKPRFHLSFRWQLIITTVFAALLLMVVNSAIWVNQNIFDTDTFTSTATTSITSESSRQALASEVVDRALVNRPVIKNVAGDTATKLVSGVLGSNQFSRVLTAAMSKLQIYLTSKDQKSVALDLTGVKDFANKILTVAGGVGADTSNADNRVDNVPDQITIVDANKVPSFYSYSVVFLWLAPLCGLLALGLLIYPYVRKGARYYHIAWVQGVGIVVAGFLSLLIGPLFRPPVLANITSANIRVVVGNLYNAFIASFNRQAAIMIVVGMLLAVLPAVFNALSTVYQRRAVSKK